MAKNFPYFKFIATEWLTGDIVFEDLQIQGLFINICALYWQRDGKLSLDDIEKRYKHNELIDKINGRFFTLKDGFISILFLDEQLIAANHTSKINSENGKKGATAKRIKATAKHSLASDKQRKEEKEEEKELNNKIPSVEEFLTYCKTIKEFNYEEFEFSLKTKYETWVADGWKDGNGKKITNWKTKIKNTLPFLKPMKQQPKQPTHYQPFI